ncbi:MAG: DUF3833 domain-containing protein [Pseudomonadota bacterium]|nr:DUF3833 domain-containing protein [Pseudomonadota bacterium]
MIRTLLLAAALAGCSAAAPAPAAAEPFDPLAFFTGPSNGVGTLKVALSSPVPIRVTSVGKPDGKGGIVLDQIIREGDNPPRERRWTMRKTSPTTMTGTITDTPGTVNGRMVDNRLLFDFTMKNGMQAHQVLTLQPGGTVLNRMTIKKFGMTVARVEETITKSE